MEKKKNMRQKICWLQINSKRYGGYVYGKKAREFLSKSFDLELKNKGAKYLRLRYLKPFEWFLNLIKLEGKRDLWIRDNLFPLITLSFDKTQGKNLALIHHLDFSDFSLALRPFFFLFEKIFYYNLKKVDAIVTVSNYWEKHFLDMGYTNVYKIYNAFDLNKFEISEDEVLEFKKRFGFERKPIIYMGNCQKAKGVVEAFAALKDLDVYPVRDYKDNKKTQRDQISNGVYLITSGEQRVKIPAMNLNLEYRDYLKLLKASLVVVTMSKFKEGWCRTAHEAMLLKTPVIGSGLGGMKELLEGGNQIICEDFNFLREKVEYLLNHPEIREKMGRMGFDYAKNFTLERFEKEWLNLIKKLTK